MKKFNIPTSSAFIISDYLLFKGVSGPVCGYGLLQHVVTHGNT